MGRTVPLSGTGAGVKNSLIVGFALHHNPDPENIPCHRVVFKDGSLSKSYAFGGIKEQKKKLEEEKKLFS